MFEFYRSQYRKELELRHELRRAVALPIGLLTILGGVITYIVRNHTFAKSFSTIILALFLLVALIFFLQAIYYVIRCIHGRFTDGGYRFQLLPSAVDIRAYEKELDDHFDSSEDAEAEFRKFLIDRMCEASNQNRTNNLSKSEYLYQANWAIIKSFASIVVGAIPFVIGLLNAGSLLQ